MAVNFGLLQQAAPVSAFFQGQQDIQQQQQQNMLRQQQAQQLAMQQENALALREQRAAQAAELKAKTERAAQRQDFLTRLGAKMAEGGYKLDRPTLGQVLQFGMQTGEDSLIKLATEGIRALDEEDLYRSEATRFGLPGGPAPATPSAPTITPAPANALVAPLATTPAGATGFTREQVQQMLTSPSARIREQGKSLAATLPKEDSTAAMREYEKAVAQGFKGTFLEYKQAIQPKPAQTTIKLPEQEKAFETELGKGQAKKLLDDKAVAEDAASIIGTVQQGRQLLQSGMITGFGAEALTQIGAALNQAGISFAADSVANTQAFAANMAQNVGRIIKQFGAGTGLSNADREYAEKMAGGKITLDRKSIERILDINERAARNVISSYNKRASSVKTNVPLTIEMPAAAPPPAAPSERPSLQDIFQPKR